MDSSNQNPEDSACEERELRIAELTEQYVLDLSNGFDSLEEIIETYPDLAPDLKRRLQFVMLLMKSASSFGGTQIDPSDESSIPQATEPESRFDDAPRIAMQKLTQLACPHCGRRMQLVHDISLSQTTCHSCGSVVNFDSSEGLESSAEKIGQWVGRFQIIKVLGQGGFGRVYLAWDTVLQRDVALKIPRLNMFSSDNQYTRFLREAKNAANLNHPNIVQVLEILNQDSLPVIVAQFIDGPTLGDFAADRILDSEQSAKIMATVADAVDFAHQKEVIHRDIKPANILLDRNRTPYVSDFGLARDMQSDITMTLDGEILGTPAFMSPEQAAGDVQNIGKLSDVYSLGVILYQLLTGVLPFRGSKRVLLEQVIRDEPIPIRKLAAEAPRELEIIAHCAMAKNPASRYPSAAEFGDDIRRWLRGEPIHATAEPAFSKIKKWYARKPIVAWLTTATACLAILTIVVATSWAIRERALAKTINRGLMVSNNRLARLYLEKGSEFLRSNQHIDSLPWFQRLADLEPENDLHILRIKQIIHSTPVLTQLWDTNGNITSGAYSANGDLLFAVSNKHVSIFDRKRQLAQKLEHDNQVVRAVLSPKSDKVLTASSNIARLWAVSSAKVLFQLKHDEQVSDVSFDSNAQRLITSSFDGTVKIWNSDDGSLLKTFDHPGRKIRSVKVSPDDKFVATIANSASFVDTEILIWNLATGESNAKLTHNGFANKIEFSPDSKRLVSTGNNHQVNIWHLDTGKLAMETLKFPTNVVDAIFSPDSQSIVLGISDGSITHWNISSEIKEHRRPNIEFRQPTGLSKIAVDWDARLLAAGGIDGKVRIFWLNHESQSSTMLPCGRVDALAFHPNGRKLMCGCKGGVMREWDLAGSNSTPILQGHTQRILDAKFSPDSKHLLTVSWDSAARLWNAQTLTPVGRPLSHAGSVFDCSFSSSGNMAVTVAADKEAKVWNTADGKQSNIAFTHDEAILRVAFHPKKDWFVATSQGGKIKCWDANTGALIFNANHGAQVRSIQFDIRGSSFATTGVDGNVILWNSLDGSMIGNPLFHEGGKVDRCHFDRDNKLLATTGGRRCVSIWNLGATSAPIQIIPLLHNATSCQFSPDGNFLITTDGSGSVIRWQRTNGGFVRQWTRKLEGHFVRYAEHSPDGKMLLVCGRRNGTTQSVPNGGAAWLLDVSNGVNISPTMHHAHRIRRAHFSPNQKLFSTASQDGTTKIWPIQNKILAGDLAKHVQLLTGQTFDDSDKLITSKASELQESFNQFCVNEPSATTCTEKQIGFWEIWIQKVNAIPNSKLESTK